MASVTSVKVISVGGVSALGLRMEQRRLGASALPALCFNSKTVILYEAVDS